MTKRRRGAELPPISEADKRALSQIDRLVRQKTLGADFGPEALFWLLQIFPPPPENTNDRESWKEALAWLASSMKLPAIEQLKNAYDDLDRGVVHHALEKPAYAGQGGKGATTERKLFICRRAVEAANEIGRRFNPTDRDDLIENVGGLKISTLRSWRSRLAKCPSRFHPRHAWLIYYGEADPVDVLRSAVSDYRS